MIVVTYRNAGKRMESTKAFKIKGITGDFKSNSNCSFSNDTVMLSASLLCYCITAMSITYLLSIEF